MDSAVTLVCGNLIHDTTTTMPGPCVCVLRRARRPERGGGVEAPQAFRRGEHSWAGWGSNLSFSPWNGRFPCPPRRIGEYWKGISHTHTLSLSLTHTHTPSLTHSVCHPLAKQKLGPKETGGIVLAVHFLSLSLSFSLTLPYPTPPCPPLSPSFPPPSLFPHNLKQQRSIIQLHCINIVIIQKKYAYGGTHWRVHLGVGLRVRFQRGASLVRDCQLVTMADAAGRVFQISTLQVTAGSSPS